METMDREAFLALTSAHPQNGAVQWARRAGRSLLRLRIYQERNPDSNPYYPKNEILRRCIAALEEIVAATGPKDCRGPERELLESLEAAPDALRRDYAYYAAHDLVSIDRIAGGHRSPIANDTEIDISIYLMDGTVPSAVSAAAGEICRRHGVRLRELAQ